MEAVTKVQIASKYGQRVRCPKTADPSITKCLPQLTRHALSLQNENPTFCNTLQPMHSNLFSSSKLSKLYLAKIAIFWEGSLQAVPAFQSSIPHPRSPKNYPLLIFPHLLINYLLNIAIDCGKFCIFARLN